MLRWTLVFLLIAIFNFSFGQAPQEQTLRDIKEFEQGYNWAILGTIVLVLILSLIFFLKAIFKKIKRKKEVIKTVTLREKFELLSSYTSDQIFIDNVRRILIDHHQEVFLSDLSMKTDYELINLLKEKGFPSDYQKQASSLIEKFIDVRFRQDVKEIRRDEYKEILEKILEIKDREVKTGEKNV